MRRRDPVPRRIIILNRTTPASATERRVLEEKIARGYQWALDAGWEVEVWGVRGRREPSYDEGAAGSAIRVRGPRLAISSLPVLTAVVNVVHLALVILHPRSGVLAGVGAVETAGAALGLRLTRRRSPLVVKVNIHSAGDSLRRRGHRFAARLLLKVERVVFRAADVIVTVGASTTQFVVDLGVPSDRIVQISAPAAGQPVGGQTRVAPVSSSERDARLIVCAARLEPRKAIDVLLQAVVAVRSNHPDVRLEIAGDGRERSALETFVRSHGLQDVVTFRGGLKRRDMPEFYERAGVFVLPSRGDEGLPKVVVEAALAGCAVVGTDVRGTDELITPGVSGELVPPDDPAALAAAIARLLSDPVRATRLAERGQEVALAHQGGNVESPIELRERIIAIQTGAR